MLKKVLLVAAATLAFGLVAKAQTNLQMFYDFGKDRQFVTTTLEGFYNDNWGNTFFFIDHDFDFKGNGGVKAPPKDSGYVPAWEPSGSSDYCIFHQSHRKPPVVNTK